ncbi:MAG: hypothetical protein ACFFDR_12590 [Candidatus Thorarchaeota archaeon]
MDIMSIASKYIVLSVVMIAIGSVSLVYSLLTYIVYGTDFLLIVIIGAVFIGFAFLLIGAFLTFWGLYWMRSEGKRLRKRLGGHKEVH